MGCGWLGLPLAKSFLDEGYRIHGSTTREEKMSLLQDQGIRPFLIGLTEDGPQGPMAEFLESLDVLIINVPPRLRGGSNENYVKKIEGLHRSIGASNVRDVIFISSTSVYGDAEGEVTEDTLPIPATESGKQLLASESILKKDSRLRTTIIRFGGLIGPNRHPVTLLSGRKGLPNGDAPVNLIHLWDCIDIIKCVVRENWWNETFNAVYPHHPTKKEYYGNEALKRQLPSPEYSETKGKNSKKINSSNLILTKNYRFKTAI